MEPQMKNSTWKITTFSDGDPVASAEGLSHAQAVIAIRRAMSGVNPLTETSGPADDPGRRAPTDARRIPVAA
jgi:hypothetical protein